jgi:hypothetical protein
MTELLDKAVAAVRKLPSRNQDEIAKTMLRLAQDSAAPEAVDPAHRASVLDGLDQARRGDMASDAEVETAFRRFDS